MTPPLAFDAVPLGAADAAFSLTVTPHAVTTVVGDAASGVGGLAALALGMTRPTAGRALVFGEDVAAMPRRQVLAFRRRVGYVPAGGGLLQNLSLADNVALPLRFGSALSHREIAGRLRMMLALGGLADAGALRPAAADEELRRRASVVRALAFDPELVLLDRPFDGVSARVAGDLLQLLRGGEGGGGSRRTIFITAQDVPDRLRPRIDARWRVVRGVLQADQ
ncbi:MAG TPA: ATP-binding cassette domain-containing protein [Gemmatimonadales bacterium]|nr:ATP-binding cassette domain-containing protein [Gemmatimonadales bacterium]